jgi:CBS domain containing-hemolysin-like protein
MATESWLAAMATPWALALGLLLSAVFSVLSALVERSGPVRLRHWVEEANGTILKAYESRPRFELFRYLLSLVAKLCPLVLGVIAGAWWVTGGSGRWTLLAGVVVVGVLFLIELFNRWLVAHLAETVLTRLTPLYRFLLVISSPLLAFLVAVFPASVFQPRDGEHDEDASEEEIEEYLAIGTREGILEPGQEELVWRVVDFGDTQVRSVMTPRIDIFGAPVGEGLEALAQRFLESGHSRLPLYEESLDRILGVLHIRDVLRALMDGNGGTVAELAKAPFFVPETKPLGELLKQMQAGHQQLAIIVDEYGGTAGLVTVEDLLEEIVGEITDEHEEDAPEIEPFPEGGCRLDGGVRVEVLDEMFDVDSDDVPQETVGGLIFSLLGYVPEEGESVTWKGLLLTVERVADRRIQSVVAERAGGDDGGGLANA